MSHDPPGWSTPASQPVGLLAPPARTSAVLTSLEARGQVPGGDAQVSSRDERVARNESTTREINEDIEQAHQAASTPDHVRIVCECGRLECDRVLAITIVE